MEGEDVAKGVEEGEEGVGVRVWGEVSDVHGGVVRRGLVEDRVIL